MSDAQKAAAQKELEAGNTEFLKQQYKEALEHYQAAIAQWDHPAIRFNVVRCLIQLDRPVDASDNLQLALKYGADPLEEAVYQEALSYQKLLAGQIGDLEISCSQEGGKVTLDGQPLLNCPGKEKRRVTPGSHGVVATKQGFLTKEMQVTVNGGKTSSVDIKLIPLDKAAKIVHKWEATWMPWVVFGGGLAVVGVGATLEWVASNTMSSYDQAVASQCAVNGCNLDEANLQGQIDELRAMDPNDPRIADLQNQLRTANTLNGQREDAESQNKIAIAVMAVGGTAAVIGGVMLFLNRGKTVYEDPTKNAGAAQAIRFAPLKDGGGVLSWSGHF